MITVTLPDGREVDVNTDDPEVARKTARNFLEKNPTPEAPAAVPAEEEEEVGTFEDIARGAGAGLVGIPQGIAELGAAGIDYAFDTNNSRKVTESFEAVKDYFGLQPTGTAGEIAESVTNFAGAAIPVIGWLGRAAHVAKGGAQLAGSASKLTRAAESFGKSKIGQALLKDRFRQAATTSVAAGVSDMIVSPDGTATISDGFDALPESLRTESDTGLQGRDEAARRLRNKLRVGAEGTAVGAAFEAAFPIAAGTARAVSQVPGVSSVAGVVSNGFDYLGRKASEIPTVKRLFTSAGEAPSDIYENMTTAEALVDEFTDAASKNLAAFDKAAKKAVKGQKLFGRGKAGINKAYDDLTRFMEGDKDALNEYGDDVVAAGQTMRDQVDSLTDMISRQLENTDVIDEDAKLKLLAELNENKGRYLRRIYENVLDPNKVIDQAVREAPAYRSAVVEISNMLRGADKKAVKEGTLKAARSKEELEEAARRIVDSELTGNAIDLGIDPAKAITLKAQNIKRGRKEAIGERPLFDVAEGIFLDRTKLIEKSPSLRTLLGEVQDPRKRYLYTVGDMSRLLSSNYLYDDIASKYMVELPEAVSMINQGGRPLVISGMNVTDKQAAELARQGYKPLSEIGGEFREGSMFGGKFGAISGGFVAPEVYSAITLPARNQSAWQEALALSLQAKGLSQMAKTVLNPLAQVRNFLSGSFMVGANANILRDMDFTDSMRLTVGKAANLADDEFRRFYEMTGKLGIRDQNLTVNEFRNLLREGQELKYSGGLSAGVEAFAEKAPLLFKPIKALQDIYSGTDTFWKIVGLNGEKAKYAAAMKKSGINPERAGSVAEAFVESGIAPRTAALPGALDDVSFLDLMASDIVKATMPTYSRVPEAIKQIRRVPLVGNFIAFPAEIIRNTANIANQGFKEMAFKATPDLVQQIGAKNARQLEKEIRAIGAQRLMGYAAMAYSVPRAAQAAAMEMTGTTEEDLQAMQKLVPEYMRGHVLLPLDKPENGKMQYIDFSYMNPYDYALAPARQALRIYEEKGELSNDEVANLTAGLWTGFTTFMEPFAGESLVAERIQNALPIEYFGRGGRTATGSIIYRQDESPGEKIRKGMNHVLGGFNPGLVEQFALERGGEFVPGRATRAATGIPGRQGQESTVKEEVLTGVTGLRRMDLDLPNTLYYRGYEYGDLRSSAVGGFNSVARRNDSTTEEILDAYVSSNENLRRAQGRLYQVVQAARQLDMKDAEIRTILKRESGLGNREIDAVMKGEFEPIRPSRDVMADVYDEARIKKQPRIVQKLPLQELLRIYSDLRRTPLVDEEIVDDTQPAFAPKQQPATQAAPAPAPVTPEQPTAPAPAPQIPTLLQAPSQPRNEVSPILVPDPTTRATFEGR